MGWKEVQAPGEVAVPWPRLFPGVEMKGFVTGLEVGRKNTGSWGSAWYRVLCSGWSFEETQGQVPHTQLSEARLYPSDFSSL